MTTPDLDAEHHAVRYVKPSFQHRPNGKCEGIRWAAFELRVLEDGVTEEKYLSINCQEKAEQPTLLEALSKIRQFMQTKPNGMQLSKNGVFAIGLVDVIKKAFLPQRVRMLHEPEEGDPTYSTIRQYPIRGLERQKALEKLAVESWKEFIPMTDLPEA